MAILPAAPAPSAAPLLLGDRPRVCIVSGSYGDGHNAAARAIAAHLLDAGCEVEVLDVIDLMPLRLGRLLRSGYYAQLRWRPTSWTTTLQHVEPGRLLHRIVTRVLRLAARRVVRATAGCDLVLSTHPFASQATGHARETRLLPVPAVTYLTDISVHALWVHPAVDLHLAIHDLAADQARGYGGRTMTISPPAPAPTAGPGPGPARPDPLTDLEIVGPVALLTGGSLGIGELEQSARDVLATRIATPVVLCGTNDALRRRLDALPGVVALGWRDDVADLLAASSCIIQNAGGFTSLEALASGTPVLTYRAIPGHGLTNAANLDRSGLVPWARSAAELRALVLAALDQPHHSRLPSTAPSVLDVLTGTTARAAA